MRFRIVLGAVASLFMAYSPLQAQLANFDVFSGVNGNIPAGYAGKNWNYIGVFDTANGGAGQASSGSEFAYVYCCPGSYPNPSITDVSNGAFSFTSAFVSSLNQTSDVFTVFGYSGATLLYTQAVTVGGGPGHTEFFNFSNVTSVVFSNDNNANMTLDDVDFSPAESTAPEPASVVLLGTGLAGVVSVARRRRKNVAA